MAKIANEATPADVAEWKRWRAKASYQKGVMNRTETAYATYLERLRMAGMVVSYAFEPEKLRLALRTYITPDFRIVLTSGAVEWHEVKPARGGGRKGFYAREDAWLKLKVAAERYPDTPFFVVWPDGRHGWNQQLVERGT